jgi:uncharacterized protein
MDQVIHDAERKRYRLEVDGGEVAYCEVDPIGAGTILIKHTEVDPKFEGKGYGATLLRGILDKARADGKNVVPICPFAAAFMRRHEEYQDLLKPGFPLGS